MGLVLFIALGIVLALVILAFLPQILKALALGALVIVAVLVLALANDVGKSHQQPSSTRDASGAEAMSQLSLVTPADPKPRFASLADRIRSGPEIAFNADDTRGLVAAALQYPGGRTNLLVGLTLFPEADVEAWTSARVATVLRGAFCGEAGLLREYGVDAARAEVTISVYGSSETSAPAALCSP